MIESFFQEILRAHTKANSLISHRNVGGGCINNTEELRTEGGTYFIKWNSYTHFDLFDKEAKGLELLAQRSLFKIPKVLGLGKNEKHAYLLLEWIDKGTTPSFFWEHFGEKLGELHQNTSSHFGLDHDNHIGRLPQSNVQHASWSDFFVLERITPQLRMARENQLISTDQAKKFDILFNRLDELIPKEPPALIHGDLWSGNFIADQSNQPVILDPAVHYGHRETELAFTTLFGGFDSIFYDHYRQSYPLEPEFGDRIDIHNIYPLLVHVNLFGTSYLSGILGTLKRFV